ncbi:hypothetical protein RB623_03150 [Mesorhizobium sp. LHD-90]|uniref:hypothetical protein n=1 Tax=Mesorhizobium sp. LHD-90 TaxID=3071414 RepID=UPI0027E19B06|nr:hypothetical protein [Mesorhizobium sp. LHD-90]MDQ6433047.1 hypothetical protein [Mesorhizobium sp. LHD-90]
MAISYARFPGHWGFDAGVSPPWQMVPVGGMRFLMVSGTFGLIPRLHIPSGSAASLTVTESFAATYSLLKLKGIRAGKAFIDWAPPGTSLSDPFASEGTLEVSVKAQKVVGTAFHYVEAGRRQTTARRISDLEGMIQGANDVLTPQANVKLESTSAKILNMRQRLGKVVHDASDLDKPWKRDEWEIVTRNADPSADFNVFFVREFEDDATPRADRTDAATRWWELNCIIEDDTRHDASEVLAHETIHLLRLGHSTKAAHLSAPGYLRTGTTITRDQANIINRSGT